MEWYDTMCDGTYPKMVHFLLLIFCASPGSGMPDEMQHGRYIIGGEDTNIAEVPYQAALFLDGKFECGATIVSSRYLLTAAHCIPSKHRKYWVRVGSSFRNKGGVIYRIKKAVKHPFYTHKEDYLDYDVGVLEVEHPIKFNARVRPIPVAYKKPKGGVKGKISGYGGINAQGDLSKQLKSAEVLILDRGRCNRLLNNTVSRRMICTTSKNSKTCANWGDSGGPLVVNGKVVGGASWFYPPPCEQPFVYSNFAAKEIRKFIRKNTGV